MKKQIYQILQLYKDIDYGINSMIIFAGNNKPKSSFERYYSFYTDDLILVSEMLKCEENIVYLYPQLTEVTTAEIKIS